MDMSFKEVLKKFRDWPLSAQMITIIIPIFSILVWVSIIFYPDFSFIDHHMSSLGSSGGNPEGFIYFVVACIITGALLVPFFIGLFRWRTDSKLFNVSLYVVIGIGFVACFGIIMQAIYRADFGTEHFYYSAVHWVADMFLLMVAPIALLLHKQYYKPISIVGVIATVFNIYYIVTWGHDAWIEWITAISTLLFAVLVGANMVRKKM